MLFSHLVEKLMALVQPLLTLLKFLYFYQSYMVKSLQIRVIGVDEAHQAEQELILFSDQWQSLECKELPKVRILLFRNFLMGLLRIFICNGFLIKSDAIEWFQGFQKAHRIDNVKKKLLFKPRIIKASILKKLNKVQQKNEYYLYESCENFDIFFQLFNLFIVVQLIIEQIEALSKKGNQMKGINITHKDDKPTPRRVLKNTHYLFLQQRRPLSQMMIWTSFEYKVSLLNTSFEKYYAILQICSTYPLNPASLFYESRSRMLKLWISHLRFRRLLLIFHFNILLRNTLSKHLKLMHNQGYTGVKKKDLLTTHQQYDCLRLEIDGLFYCFKAIIILTLKAL